MKITKYLHSCLLLTLEDQRLLFDPGSFSFAHGEVSPADIPPIDYLVITHDHPDHLYFPAVRAFVDRDAPELIANAETAERLRAEGLPVTVVAEGAARFGAFELEALPVDHQPILADHRPQVTAFRVNGRLVNPADSFSDDLLRWKGCALLCCPVLAPFLTEVDAFAFMERMAPGAVLPVHEGYAKPYFVEARHANYRTRLERIGIGFHGVVAPGGSVEA
ncbi:MBL fold metallo-hydrolase [Lewinella sp. IMCC34183]|uniref:MBL fold metallo-hydrolase n=1 Tax=Lewinella sp. IMCC34183 TaxID=2248762 RepID=UPI000E244A6A|nr:MBL fold metallo-hydrolase [Lewinella sp. IMCC34183]